MHTTRQCSDCGFCWRAGLTSPLGAVLHVAWLLAPLRRGAQSIRTALQVCHEAPPELHSLGIRVALATQQRLLQQLHLLVVVVVLL